MLRVLIAASVALVMATPAVMAFGLRGDLNCDGSVNNFDIDAFVLVLTATPPGYAEYYAQYPGCDHTLGDMDCDGTVSNFDIDAFVACLTGGCAPCPGDMVLITGGEYEMGDHYGVGNGDELPVHAVLVDSFYMERLEVTNQQYCDYLNAAYALWQVQVISDVVYQEGDVGYIYCYTHGYDSDSRIQWDGVEFSVTPGKEDHAVLEVTWYGAAAYCNWRSGQDGRTPCYDLAMWDCNMAANGYRLPTEAEWEYAARGGDYGPYHQYYWGDTIAGSNANYYYSGDPYEAGDFPWTTPVAYYNGDQIPAGVDMANGYGLYDMSGNVWEWCNDWYNYSYYASSSYDNPLGPVSGDGRVVRVAHGPARRTSCAALIVTGTTPAVPTTPASAP